MNHKLNNLHRQEQNRPLVCYSSTRLKEPTRAICSNERLCCLGPSNSLRNFLNRCT